MEDFPLDSINEGASLYVFTTHITSQELFFVHVEDQVEILDEIMEKLAERYTGLGPCDKPLLNKRPGTLCAAKFTDDDNWYRAKITDVVRNGLIEVQFVDYGNTDYVSEDRVKSLDSDLVLYPVQSYRCALADVSCAQGFWSPELMVQFEDRVIDRRCKAIFRCKRDHDEVYLVEMFDEEGNSINELFGAVKTSVRSASVSTQSSSADSIKETVWSPGDTIQASVVYCDSPSLFWCQATAFANEILILSEELSRLHMTQGIKPLKQVTPGTVCAAKFSEDEAWYRGVVQSVSSNAAKVYFLDYGNTESVSLEFVCNLKPEMRKLPALAVQCCLDRAHPRGSSWHPGVIEKFDELVADKEFDVKVVSRNGKICSVTLLDIVENKDILSLLQPFVDKYNAKSVTPSKEVKKSTLSSYVTSETGPTLPVGSKVPVFLSWVESPGDFWVQCEDSQVLLENLSAELQSFYSQPQPIATPSPGAFVVARSCEDQVWYRGLVIRDLEDGNVKVLYIDYGNSETLAKEELRQVSGVFGEIVPLASLCSLVGVKPLRRGDRSWSGDAKDFLENLTIDGCMCEVLDATDSHRLVRLSSGGKDVARELVGLNVVADSSLTSSTHAPAKYTKKIHLTKSQRETVTVTFVESPHSFWCQLEKNRAMLSELMDKLNLHYSENGGTPLREPAVGQACIAQYSEDNGWYRAAIQKVNSSSCEVFFVDYGNKESVTFGVLCQPEPRFLDLPIQAVHCSLPVGGNISNLSDALSDLAQEKEFEMVALEVASNPVVVDLYDGPVKVTDYLKSLTTKISPVKQPSQSTSLAPAKAVPLNTTVKAFTSMVESPSSFFLQLSGVDEALGVLMDNIAVQYVCEIPPPILSNPQPGQSCVALYPEDDNWYRAKILSITGNSSLVLFVDYGNKETIALQNIRVMTPAIASVPVMAYECSLHGIEAASWPDKAIEMFESLVMDEELDCTFVTATSVKLVSRRMDVVSELVRAGYGKAAGSGKPVAPRVPVSEWEEEEDETNRSPTKFQEERARGGETRNRNDLGGFGDADRRQGSGKEFSSTGGSKDSFSGTGSQGWKDKDSEGGGKFGGRDRGFGGRPERDGGSGGRTESGFGGRPERDGGSGGRTESGFGGRPERDGGYGGRTESGFGGRPERDSGFGGRPERDGGSGGRPERDSGFGGRPERDGGSGGRPERDSGFGGRPERDGGSGGRPESGFGGRPERDGGFGGRSERDGGSGGRTESGFGGRPERDGGSGGRTESGFGGRPERDGGSSGRTESGFGGRPERDSGFGGKGGRDGGFGGRAERESGFGGRPERDGRTESGFGGRNERDGGFGGRDRKPEAGSSISAEFTYPDLPSAPEKALLIQMDDDGTFYIQLLSKEKDIFFLTKKLASSYKNGGPRLRETPEKGVACCAKYEDGNMCRCLIEEVKGNNAVLRFVDYGNIGEYSVRDLKMIFPDILEFPVQALPCKLRGLSWSLEKTEKFASLTLDKELVVTFCSSSRPYEVDIQTPDGDLLAILSGKSASPAPQLSPPRTSVKVEKFSPKPSPFSSPAKSLQSDQGSARSVTIEQKPSPQKPPTPTVAIPKQEFVTQTIPVGSVVAFISHVGETGYFYLQLEKDTELLEDITSKLEAMSSSLVHPNVQVGAACAAVFSEDSALYRAQITSCDGKNVRVTFVDFGNGDTVALSHIQPLTKELLACAPLAYQCQFPDLGPLSPELQAKLTEFIDLSLTVNISGTVPPYSVNVMTSDGLDLQEILSPSTSYKSQVVPTEVIPAGVSVIADDGRFFIQLYRDYSAIAEICKTLSSVYSNKDLGKLNSDEHDVPCLVYLSDEAACYRSKIIEVGGETVTVTLVDTGKTVSVAKDSLLSLPVEFLKNPPFAYECRLNGVDSWSSSLREKFTDMTEGKILNATFFTKTPPYRVSLARSIELDLLDLSAPVPDAPVKSSSRIDSEQEALPTSEVIDTTVNNLTSEVKSLSLQDNTNNNEASRVKQHSTGLSDIDGQRLAVSVSFVCSPDLFYLHLEREKPNLDTLMDEMYEHYSTAEEELLESPAVGDVCAALYEDESWYRVMIKSISDNGTCQIFYIDHGNTEEAEVTSLQKLAKKFKSVKNTLITARLGGVVPKGESWSDEDIDTFRELVEEKPLIADFLEVNKDELCCTVHLLYMGIPIHEELIKKDCATRSSEVVVSSAIQHVFSDADSTILQKSDEFNSFLESTHLEGDDKTAKQTMMSSSAHANHKIGCVSNNLEELGEVSVFVSHSESPSLFWCQLASSTDTLEEMAASLESSYRSPQAENEISGQLNPGDIVVARYSEDDQFYRAKILQCGHIGDSAQYSVRFIDYGNDSDVSVDSVFKVKDDLCRWPMQAFCCCLDKAAPIQEEWLPEVNEKFSEMVADQELLLKLVGREEGKVLVDLVIPETEDSLTALLVSGGLAKTCDTESNDNAKEATNVKQCADTTDVDSLEITQPIMESTAVVGETTQSELQNFSIDEAEYGCYRKLRLSMHTEYDVIVSNDELPNSFHVQLQELKCQFSSMMLDLAEFMESNNPLEPPQIKTGDQCLFQHSDVWHRGEIISQETSLWNVKSVDCGWEATVSPDKVAELPSRYLDLPAQAVPCYLAGVVSVDSEWSSDAITFFKDCIIDRKLCMYVLENANDGKYGVYLSDLDNTGTQSINRAMVDLEYADVVPGSNIDVQMEMEKTLDTDMLKDLEESFNEVSILKCNAPFDEEAVSEFENPLGDTYEESEIYKTITKHMRKNLDENISLSASADTTREAETPGLAVANASTFNLASAVEKIDRLGCMDVYNEETLSAVIEEPEDDVECSVTELPAAQSCVSIKDVVECSIKIPEDNKEFRVEEPDNDECRVEEPEDDECTVEEPEDDECTVEEPDDDECRVEEPEDDECTVEEPDDDECTVEEPEDDECTVEEPEDKEYNVKETKDYVECSFKIPKDDDECRVEETKDYVECSFKIPKDDDECRVEEPKDDEYNVKETKDYVECSFKIPKDDDECRVEETKDYVECSFKIPKDDDECRVEEPKDDEYNVKETKDYVECSFKIPEDDDEYNVEEPDDDEEYNDEEPNNDEEYNVVEPNNDESRVQEAEDDEEFNAEEPEDDEELNVEQPNDDQECRVEDDEAYNVKEPEDDEECTVKEAEDDEEFNAEEPEDDEYNVEQPNDDQECRVEEAEDDEAYNVKEPEDDEECTVKEAEDDEEFNAEEPEDKEYIVEETKDEEECRVEELEDDEECRVQELEDDEECRVEEPEDEEYNVEETKDDEECRVEEVEHYEECRVMETKVDFECRVKEPEYLYCSVDEPESHESKDIESSFKEHKDDREYRMEEPEDDRNCMAEEPEKDEYKNIKETKEDVECRVKESVKDECEVKQVKNKQGKVEPPKKDVGNEVKEPEDDGKCRFKEPEMDEPKNKECSTEKNVKIRVKDLINDECKIGLPKGGQCRAEEPKKDEVKDAREYKVNEIKKSEPKDIKCRVEEPEDETNYRVGELRKTISTILEPEIHEECRVEDPEDDKVSRINEPEADEEGWVKEHKDDGESTINEPEVNVEWSVKEPEDIKGIVEEPKKHEEYKVKQCRVEETKKDKESGIKEPEVEIECRVDELKNIKGTVEEPEPLEDIRVEDPKYDGEYRIKEPKDIKGTVEEPEPLEDIRVEDPKYDGEYRIKEPKDIKGTVEEPEKQEESEVKQCRVEETKKAECEEEEPELKKGEPIKIECRVKEAKDIEATVKKPEKPVQCKVESCRVKEAKDIEATVKKPEKPVQCKVESCRVKEAKDIEATVKKPEKPVQCKVESCRVKEAKDIEATVKKPEKPVQCKVESCKVKEAKDIEATVKKPEKPVQCKVESCRVKEAKDIEATVKKPEKPVQCKVESCRVKEPEEDGVFNVEENVGEYMVKEIKDDEEFQVKEPEESKFEQPKGGQCSVEVPTEDECGVKECEQEHHKDIESSGGQAKADECWVEEPKYLKGIVEESARHEDSKLKESEDNRESIGNEPEKDECKMKQPKGGQCSVKKPTGVRTYRVKELKKQEPRNIECGVEEKGSVGEPEKHKECIVKETEDDRESLDEKQEKDEEHKVKQPNAEFWAEEPENVEECRVEEPKEDLDCKVKEHEKLEKHEDVKCKFDKSKKDGEFRVSKPKAIKGRIVEPVKYEECRVREPEENVEFKVNKPKDEGRLGVSKSKDERECKVNNPKEEGECRVSNPKNERDSGAKAPEDVGECNVLEVPNLQVSIEAKNVNNEPLAEEEPLGPGDGQSVSISVSAVIDTTEQTQVKSLTGFGSINTAADKTSATCDGHKTVQCCQIICPGIKSDGGVPKYLFDDSFVVKLRTHCQEVIQGLTEVNNKILLTSKSLQVLGIVELSGLDLTDLVRELEDLNLDVELATQECVVTLDELTHAVGQIKTCLSRDKGKKVSHDCQVTADDDQRVLLSPEVRHVSHSASQPNDCLPSGIEENQGGDTAVVKRCTGMRYGYDTGNVAPTEPCDFCSDQCARSLEPADVSYMGLLPLTADRFLSSAVEETAEKYPSKADWEGPTVDGYESCIEPSSQDDDEDDASCYDTSSLVFTDSFAGSSLCITSCNTTGLDSSYFGADFDSSYLEDVDSSCFGAGFDSSCLDENSEISPWMVTTDLDSSELDGTEIDTSMLSTDISLYGTPAAETSMQATTDAETSTQATTEAETSTQQTTEAETSTQQTTEAETSTQQTTEAETSTQQTTEAETSTQQTTEAETSTQQTTEAETSTQQTTEAETSTQQTTEAETSTQQTTEAETSTQQTTEAETSTQQTTEAETSTQQTTEAETSTQQTTEAETSTQQTTEAETSTQQTTEAETSTQQTTEAETSTQQTTEAETSTQATTEAETSTQQTTEAETSTQGVTEPEEPHAMRSSRPATPQVVDEAGHRTGGNTESLPQVSADDDSSSSYTTSSATFNVTTSNTSLDSIANGHLNNSLTTKPSNGVSHSSTSPDDSVSSLDPYDLSGANAIHSLYDADISSHVDETYMPADQPHSDSSELSDMSDLWPADDLNTKPTVDGPLLDPRPLESYSTDGTRGQPMLCSTMPKNEGDAVDSDPPSFHEDTTECTQEPAVDTSPPKMVDEAGDATEVVDFYKLDFGIDDDGQSEETESPKTDIPEVECPAVESLKTDDLTTEGPMTEGPQIVSPEAEGPVLA
ncbi:uncharacterized protein LOC131954068 isoform X2 [Physella acuta]|uniref:uncharacterized protein LOC131954068 isoform X2 n=1 Tax=Physella acuta TaxID=109671 RepID=UPI0027DE1D33|nr:uncharacterized protein LOC131954068 isoform X2 [Physella acuta]